MTKITKCNIYFTCYCQIWVRNKYAHQIGHIYRHHTGRHCHQPCNVEHRTNIWHISLTEKIWLPHCKYNSHSQHELNGINHASRNAVYRRQWRRRRSLIAWAELAIGQISQIGGYFTCQYIGRVSSVHGAHVVHQMALLCNGRVHIAVNCFSK